MCELTIDRPPLTYICSPPFANCCRSKGEWFCCKTSPNCCNGGGPGRSGGDDAPQRARTAWTDDATWRFWILSTFFKLRFSKIDFLRKIIISINEIENNYFKRTIFSPKNIIFLSMLCTRIKFYMPPPPAPTSSPQKSMENIGKKPNRLLPNLTSEFEPTEFGFWCEHCIFVLLLQAHFLRAK